MRYLFGVISNRNQEVTADSVEADAIDRFNEKLEAAGHRILAIGLSDPSSSVVFDNRKSLGNVSLGPIVDHDDFVAGLWIIDAPSDHVAHQLAGEASLACNRRIEVRKVL